MPISESAQAETRAPLKSGWYFFLIVLALGLLAFDQYSKWLAIQHLSYGVPVPVLQPWLNWTLVHNFGAAFSFLSQSGGMQHWFFAAIAAGAGIGLPIWISRLKNAASANDSASERRWRRTQRRWQNLYSRIV